MEEERHGATGAQRVGPDVFGCEAKGGFATAEAAIRSELSEEVEAGDADRPAGES